MSKGNLVPRETALVAAQPILDLFPGCTVVGSIRRGKAEVHDVDVLVFGDPRDAKSVAMSTRCGAKRGSFILDGVQVDVIHVPDQESLGAMLLHFTGSKEHNIVMRAKAIEMGLKLNEYGLWERDTGVRINANTEDEIFRALGMESVPPDLREVNLDAESAA
jgi:DNA polymerase (family 10)